MSTTAYDPAARRDTPLAARIKQLIRDTGPISVADYVSMCLTDPEHGYYTTRSAIGAEADFITAPEITQIFGELIGIWCAVTWQQLGSPSRFNIVELGPGRGTMISDALRAMAKLPGLIEAAHLHLVDISSQLSATQEQRLQNGRTTFSQWPRTDDLLADSTTYPGPWIVIANEYLDALGVRQFVANDGRWHQREVCLNADGELDYAVGGPTQQPFLVDAAEQANDAIFECCDAFQQSVAPFLGSLAEMDRLAALFIDYGHEQSAPGETLQAVRDHAYEHPLASPGEADLTAQVDFANFATIMQGAGLAADGPTTQAEFLGRLGIVERTSRLMSANPDKAASIEAGTLRLMAPNGMGTRFKAIGVRSAGLAPLPCLG